MWVEWAQEATAEDEFFLTDSTNVGVCFVSVFDDFMMLCAFPVQFD